MNYIEFYSFSTTATRTRVASKALVERDESSSESEWEEVEEAQEVMKEPVVPKEGVEIVLAQPKVWKRRQHKKKFDMAVFVRRQINRFKKDVQESLHKVHLLCLLARGMIVNRIVKGTLVEAIVFSVIPEEIHEVKSYNFSIATLQKMLLWFRGYFLYSFQYQSDCDHVDFENMITRYCETKVISCLLDYVLLFVVVCRVVGCKVRLCSSLYPFPLKPSDLLRKHSSKKKLEEEIVAEENNMPEQDIQSGKKVNIKKSNYSNNKLKNCKETGISSTSYNPIMNNKVPKSKNKGKNCKKIRTSLCKNNNIDMNADTSKEFITSNVKSDKYGQNQEDKSFEVAKMRKSRKLSKNESTVMKSKGKEVCKIDSYKLRKREYVKKLYKDTSSDDETKDSDSDFDNCESFKPQVQKTVHSKKSPILVSSDDNSAGKSKNSKTSASDNVNTVKVKHWIEIFCPDENRWISVDCVNNIFDEPHIIEQCVAKPLMYVLTFDNNGRVKDVTKRYASDWMTSTQKDRVDGTWWEETLRPFKPLPDETDRNEDLQMEVMLMEKPLPTTISEFKNHPLYALKRHLLKFEAIYPPDAPPLGYIRGEPVYARECVHTLHSRETWMKEARVVRIGEQPYKIVKGRPKWDRSVGELKRDIQLEVFGKWQTEEYIPPVARDGKVPRNEYGNIELFQPSMLPKGTVHLQLPALNRIAKKLGIDCAPALVGFDGHGGGVHPVFDGWVVCEEYSDTLQAAWEEEQENARRRAEEKREKRVYGNWKKLIKGILIRERLQAKYNVGASK
ncbi:DNA repair protein complementing XP-C cells homolog isoform X2 [Tachypleus tridentatus]|uniref:DNA repair protein complementing XP-C cells homolog isoform X2 n=1 Tax=Tachypleus tridentatus TaxID=6853 RepID=UPI003FD221B0